MKKIGFIGGYDKTDFMLYIAKILTEMNNKVLVIDATITQKAKYVVPAISPTRTYFTEYEKIDVAVGFKSITEMADYLGVDENTGLKYDYMFIDVDTPETFNSFGLETANLNYFVTSFDLYSIKRGLEIIKELSQPIKMVRVLFTKHMSKAENEYLDFLSENLPVEWAEDKVYFPFEQGDQSVIIENQRVEKIKMRNLSSTYKDGLLIMASQITDNSNFGEFKRAMRNIERGV